MSKNYLYKLNVKVSGFVKMIFGHPVTTLARYVTTSLDTSAVIRRFSLSLLLILSSAFLIAYATHLTSFGQPLPASLLMQGDVFVRWASLVIRESAGSVS